MTAPFMSLVRASILLQVSHDLGDFLLCAFVHHDCRTDPAVSRRVLSVSQSCLGARLDPCCCCIGTRPCFGMSQRCTKRSSTAQVPVKLTEPLAILPPRLLLALNHHNDRHTHPSHKSHASYGAGHRVICVADSDCRHD